MWTAIANGSEKSHAREKRGERRQRNPATLGSRSPLGPIDCRSLARELSDFDPRIADVLQPLASVLPQTELHQSQQRARRVSGKPAPVDLVAQDRGNGIGWRLAAKSTLAGEHLEKKTAERPHVGAFVDALTARLLRAHVTRRSQNDPCDRRGRRRELGPCGRFGSGLVVRFSEPEIENFDVALMCDLDVRRLQVAMDDPFAMRLADRFRNLFREVQELEKLQRSASDTLGERWAFGEFQDQVPLIVDAQQIVNGSDVGVIQAREKLGLALKAAERRAIGGEISRQNLDGDFALEVGIFRTVNTSHAPAAEQIQDFVWADVISWDDSRVVAALELPRNFFPNRPFHGSAREERILFGAQLEQLLHFLTERRVTGASFA